MKFIFPQNYNFNSKIFGFIDHSSAIVDLIWGMIAFLIVKIFFKSISTKILTFIILFFPILIFSIVGVQGENLLYFLSYMLKFAIKQKLYFYDKQ